MSIRLDNARRHALRLNDLVQQLSLPEVAEISPDLHELRKLLDRRLEAAEWRRGFRVPKESHEQ